MDYLEAALLYESDAFAVRVVPPDELVLLVGGRERRLRRSELRNTQAARLAWIRQTERVDPLPGAHDEAFAVDLVFTDGRKERLGPFERTVGLGAGHALEQALADFLLIVDGVTARVVRGGVNLLVENAVANHSVTVPVKLHTVRGAAVRSTRDRELEGAYRAAMDRPAAERLRQSKLPRFYVALLGTQDPRVAVGPFSREDALRFARGVTAWCEAHPIDDTIVDVSAAELAADPVRFHMRRVRVSAEWHDAFEGSSFCGVWLSAPKDAKRAPRANPYGGARSLVRVVGRWIYPRSVGETERGGFGHMGLSPGELVAETLEPLD